MKTKLILLMTLSFVLLITNCKKDNENGAQLTTAERLGKVGNTWNGTFPEGQKMSAQITKNENSIVTLKVDFEGEIYEFKLKISDNSISDFVYSNGDESKPYTLIQKDAKVGDRYTYESNGYAMGEREVVEVGTEYHINCLGKKIPTIGVAEYIPYGLYPTIFGYTISLITWYISWEYGIVCIGISTYEGDYFEIEFSIITVG